MITTRRSFVKGLSAVIGAIPLPGMVKQLVEALKPEEQTLEDAEDILRGLIARCTGGPIDEREASLVGSFLNRMKPTEEQMEVLCRFQQSYHNATDAEKAEMKRRTPYSVRFITEFVKGCRPQAWFAQNFKLLNRRVMPGVVEVFNHPRFREATKRA